MNIKQAVELSAIQQESSAKKPSRKLSAVAVAKRVFQLAASGGHPFKGITAEQWAKKWLASDEFVLTEIQATKVALPLVPQDQNLVLRNMAAAADSVEPIVVDINKRHIGASPSGFLPKVIVVDGKHRHKAATMQGRMKLQAWVGIQAAGYLGIQADHDFSSNELSQKIGEALREKFAPKKKGKNADAGMASSLPYPWVQETYPFESYFIYQYEGKFFKQAYEENDKDRTIKLTGEPEVVIQKYTPIKAAAVKYTKLDIAAAVTVIPSQDKAENGSAPHGRMPGVKGDKLYTAGAGGVGGSLGNGSGPTPPMKAEQAAPGAGVGPRLPQNKGAKKSELQDMKFDVTKVNKIVTDYNAVGTAEGVVKEWETRHGESGNFQPAMNQNTYQAPSGTQVQVHTAQPAVTAPKTMSVHQVSPQGTKKQVFQGPHKAGHGFLKQKYGIVHTTSNWSGKGWRHKKSPFGRPKFGLSKAPKEAKLK